RPNDVLTATTVASELEQLGCIDQAAAVLEDASSRSPQDAGIHHALGAFLQRRGRLSEALIGFERALSLEPQHLRATLDRGHVLEALGRPEEAAASFNAALGLKWQCTEALAGLVSCAFRLCNWNQLDAYLPALQAMPDGLDALHPFLLLAMDLS